MDINFLLSSLQLGVSLLQLKLDHFTKPSNRQNTQEVDEFYQLGEAVRALEFALSETVDFIGQTTEREPNPKLAEFWRNASESIRNVNDTADLVDLTFEKHLYWLNPDFFRGQNNKQIYRISLKNVLIQLRKLRTEYERLHRKITT